MQSKNKTQATANIEYSYDRVVALAASYKLVIDELADQFDLSKGLITYRMSQIQSDPIKPDIENAIKDWSKT